MVERDDLAAHRSARRRRAVLGATWLLLCAAADANGAGPSDDPALTQVQQLIGEAACKTNDDCRTIAIGVKACGGPEAYLAWSARHTDPKALAAAAARYADERRAQHEKTGLVSNCAFVSDPGARCEAVRGGDAESAGGKGSAAGAASASSTRALPQRCVLNRGHGGAASKAN